MRRLLLLLPVALLLTVLVPMGGQAQLVDSLAVDAVDVFSDTTDTVDRSAITAVTDSITAWSGSDKVNINGLGWLAALLGGTAIGTVWLLVLVPLLLFFILPLLVLALIVWLIVRNRRESEQEKLNTAYSNETEKETSKPEMNNKKLTRSRDKVLGGVCGGLAEYFGLDITLVRLVYAVLTLFTSFAGIIIYIVLWIVMPSKR